MKYLTFISIMFFLFSCDVQESKNVYTAPNVPPFFDYEQNNKQYLINSMDNIKQNLSILLGTEVKNLKEIKINFDNMLNEILAILHSKNIQSVIVEGGTKTIQSFINNNLWDEARIFKTKNNINEGVKSPSINGKIISTSFINKDTLNILVNE